MIARTFEIVTAVWPGILLGTGLILVAAAAGSAMAPLEHLAPVRFIRWWIRRVVLPVLHSSSWFRRMSIIFANNTANLAIVLAAGHWRVGGILAVAAVGIALGIGLRVLASEEAGVDEDEAAAAVEHPSIALRLGMGLNLLEIPAIMLTLGLSLHRSVLHLPANEVWLTFAVWVVPALLVAAAGEALWMGAVGFHKRPAPADSLEPDGPGEGD